MDIKKGGTYPSNALSNLAPHPFVIDGVSCNSMEGFLQSLKFKNPEMQKQICSLSGAKAKLSGSKKNWKQDQTLYWKGKAIKRDSKEYQELLDKAFDCISKNDKFKKALLSTGNSALTHSLGKNDRTQTVLTSQEFCSRLLKLRNKLIELKI